MRTINTQNPIQPLRFALSPTHRNPNPKTLISPKDNLRNPHLQKVNIPKQNSNSSRSPYFHSANVSRQKICIEETEGKYLQFNKQLRNRLKPIHKRTRSNCVDLLKEEDESNFSNSLQNISEEIIEIPFANKVISPRNNRNIPKKEKKQEVKFIQDRKVKHKMSSSAEGKISFQRKSAQKVKITNNKENIFGIKKPKENTWKIPKPQKFPTKTTQICLSHFSLKPIKITQKGSILYIAMHKQTHSIFAIKSIKKRLLLSRLPSFILQMKLGLTIQHPNISKIYGYFSEGDNFYIIKQFLEQGCIFDRQIHNEGDIGCQINQFMNAILTLFPLKGYQLIFNHRQLSQTYGICKITTIHISKDNSLGSFSNHFKSLLLSLLDRDRRQIGKDHFQTKQSIFFHSLNKNIQGSFFFNKFKEIIEQSVIMSEHQILMIWQSDFLRLYRSKSLMRQ